MKPKNFSAAVFFAVILSGFAGNAFACGPFFPNNLLDAGDHAVLQSPVADFQRELERMKLVTTRTRAVPLAVGQKYFEQATETEMTDLAAAFTRQKISSAQAVVIMQAHLAERMKLNAFLKAQEEWNSFHAWGSDANGYHELPNTNPPPVFPVVAVTPGLPREFALYFQGAIAWQKPGASTPYDRWQLRQAWEQLLELPPVERHFKSTWAAFMLAKHYENPTNDWTDTEAIKYFEQVRALAKNGFADSSGLATASLGGEARIYLRRKNYEHALELYLEQMAAGDVLAANSLRFTAAAVFGTNGATAEQLAALVKNSRTRRVLTAYLISHPFIICDGSSSERVAAAKEFYNPAEAWLEAVDAAQVHDVEYASQLALAAYQANRMDIAQRWIRRAGKEPVARWLQAKLFLHDGKISEAVKLLSKLSREFPPASATTGTSGDFIQNLSVSVGDYNGDAIPIEQQVSGELGVLHLARREYTEALDALLRSGYYWMDAAYVAERVLTTDELKAYVDRNWPEVSPAQIRTETVHHSDGDRNPENIRAEIRTLLARRLARENHFVGTRNYFPAELRINFDWFTTALNHGLDETLQKEVRAKHLFAAAVVTCANGMELFGTELEPDWAIYGGEYELGGIGVSRATSATNNPPPSKINLADPQELARVAARNVNPDKRFHYRYRAADLAWAAATLMPENADETARMLCTGGTWLKNRDPQAADKFYKALVNRCRKTAIGAQADRMRWFPVLDENGNPKPWSPPRKNVAVSGESSEPGVTNVIALVVLPPLSVMTESNSTTAPAIFPLP